MTKHQIDFLKAAAYKADKETSTDASRAEYFRAVKPRILLELLEDYEVLDKMFRAPTLKAERVH
jgi:hypothetical protein